jgi:hypothetical protein
MYGRGADQVNPTNLREKTKIGRIYYTADAIITIITYVVLSLNMDSMLSLYWT